MKLKLDLEMEGEVHLVSHSSLDLRLVVALALAAAAGGLALDGYGALLDGYKTDIIIVYTPINLILVSNMG